VLSSNGFDNRSILDGVDETTHVLHHTNGVSVNQYLKNVKYLK
jgi:hypothetical protein